MDDLDVNENSLEEENEQPIPFDDDPIDNENISHSPLDLGGGDSDTGEGELIAEVARPSPKKPAEQIVSSERITGMRTFFTKLQGGSIEYLDGQITNWLKENPGITVKLTNMTSGPVIGKTTEPNLIITVWY